MSMTSGSVHASPAVRLIGRLRAHVWPLFFAMLAIGAVISFLPRLVYGPIVEAERVQGGDLVQTVVATGHVETPYRVEIGAQVTGTVAEVLVQEGESVKQGQTLIVLESSEAKAALVQAQASLAQSQAKIRQLREFTLPSAQENLKQAQATLENAQAAYDRVSALLKSGFQTKAALDDAQKALDIARTLVRTAELLVYTNSPGGSDYVMAETQLEQSQANLASATARLSYLTIAAPRDGILISRSVERGAVVQPGRALLILAPTGDVQLVLQIDEKNLGMVALGQNALVSADAYPDKIFPARVTYINPSVDITRASVEVKLTADEPPAFVRQDMTVSVDIEVASRQDTLIVSTRAVHDFTSSPWIARVDAGRVVKQPVSLGLRAAGKIELLKGASAGDRVLPVTSGIAPGARVRLASP